MVITYIRLYFDLKNKWFSDYWIRFWSCKRKELSDEKAKQCKKLSSQNNLGKLQNPNLNIPFQGEYELADLYNEFLVEIHIVHLFDELLIILLSFSFQNLDVVMSTLPNFNRWTVLRLTTILGKKLMQFFLQWSQIRYISLYIIGWPVKLLCQVWMTRRHRSAHPHQKVMALVEVEDQELLPERRLQPRKLFFHGYKKEPKTIR